MVGRIGLGGFPFGGLNKARGWDPFTASGRRIAVATIHAAIDAGINYIDTAPAYGSGNSESIIGEVMKDRRGECILATKVGYRGITAAAVIKSVEESLTRLAADMVDIVQFHGGMYEQDDVDHILNGGLAEALIRNPFGGAIAVWASSGLTEPYAQSLMNREFIRLLISGAHPTLGEAVRQAKEATDDPDVRKTWVLLGDPSMGIQAP